jgi:predicted nucleotidyltransferase component of viral defense system
MKDLRPQEPNSLPIHVRACLEALVKAGLGDRISLGGGVALSHYLDYRSTHDVDAWWAEALTEPEKKSVVQILEETLTTYGDVRVRTWGEVVSVELAEDDQKHFSFQIAARSARLDNSVPAGWIDVPVDSLTDLVASKMNALVERGAPRDFLDIFVLCQNSITDLEECWALWRKRLELFGSAPDYLRARTAIETHLERIALQRPLDGIQDPTAREQAARLRTWYREEFLRGTND